MELKAVYHVMGQHNISKSYKVWHKTINFLMHSGWKMSLFSSCKLCARFDPVTQFTIKSQVVCHPFISLAWWFTTSTWQSNGGYVYNKASITPILIIIRINCTKSRLPTKMHKSCMQQPRTSADISQFDGSFSRLAGYESSLDGTSLWNRRGFTTTSRFSILDCFFACQKRIKQYIAKRKVIMMWRLCACWGANFYALLLIT